MQVLLKWWGPFPAKFTSEEDTMAEHDDTRIDVRVEEGRDDDRPDKDERPQPTPPRQDRMAAAMAEDLERHVVPTWMLKVLALLLFLAAGAVSGYFLTKHSAKSEKVVATDPCAGCRANDLVVRKMDSKDNYLWSGTCTGGDACASCAVIDCVADDNETALKKCPCRK